MHHIQDENKEAKRVDEKNKREKHWLKWGPYLSERQWGTVREDYSEHGDAWNYVSYKDACSRAYRWGEDGIAGISDDKGNICLSLALWNGKDAILKERLFGLSNPQGNHGEDVKELYYYLDNTPTHAYMKYLYKYPQNTFPYKELIQVNKKRTLEEAEYELLETGIFDNDEYFDVYVEYAKADVDDVFIKISVANRSNKAADIHVLPTLFMRNKWSFVHVNEKPFIRKSETTENAVDIHSPESGDYKLYFDKPDEWLFTENETNERVIFKRPNNHPYKKDLFHRAVIKNNFKLTSKIKKGTKFSPLYRLTNEAGATHTLHLRLTSETVENPLAQINDIFYQRIHESNVFYKNILPSDKEDWVNIYRQALAGMLWSKQYYNYNVEQWLEGDLQHVNPSMNRYLGRNAAWKTLRNEEILLMPDKWEYPWYASWDSAFHVVTMALVDVEFAKNQLLIFLKEWYMKPNGQIPAYEWNFSDVNPPVQPWAALMIFNLEKKKTGKGDIVFLKQIFNKLALNFTWWVNRLDHAQSNVFEGGFLGLDNIGVFDRSQGVPGKARLEQVDGTAWMALYCLMMLKMSLHISKEDPAFEDMATKYFGHFVYIAESLNHISEDYIGIWDETDGFFYDKLVFPDGREEAVKVRSIVGMLSLIAVMRISQDAFESLPKFKKSFTWFKENTMHKLKFPVVQQTEGCDDVLLSLVPKDRIDRLMKSLLDEKEFLSPFGIRSLSKIYEEPYIINLEGNDYEIQFQPAESDSSMFGGNSNWRGPVWFPINYILIESLRELYKFFGPDKKYTYPSGGKEEKDLKEISEAISKRLISIFENNAEGNRPVNGLHKEIYRKDLFKDLILFYEYFHSENGRGVGAAHQTGWTALVANLIQRLED